MIIVRRSVLEDGDKINILQCSNNICCWSRTKETNVFHLIEESFICITATDLEGVVVGFLSFDDCLPGGSSDARDWLASLTKNSQCGNKERFTIANTLFISHFISCQDWASSVIDRALNAIFATLPIIDHILNVLPECGETDLKTGKFEKIQSRPNPDRSGFT